MLFNVQRAMVIDGTDQAQAEIITLGALQAAKAEVPGKPCGSSTTTGRLRVATRSRPHRPGRLCRSKMPEGHVTPSEPLAWGRDPPPPPWGCSGSDTRHGRNRLSRLAGHHPHHSRPRLTTV